VVNPAKQVSRFVAVSFPGGSLPPPRFGGAPSASFEFGGEGGSRLFRLARRGARVQQAVDRASALFEAAVPAGHRGYLDAYWSPQEHHAVDPEAQLLHLVPEERRALAELTDGKNLDAIPTSETPYVRLTVPLGLRELDHGRLFRLLANGEVGLSPGVAGARLYLVDETDPLVFAVEGGTSIVVHTPRAARLDALSATVATDAG
jgi:hypothetical protein